jgi:hypothetical protein
MTHPITPTPELIKNWHDEWDESDQIVHSAYTHIAIRAAQWGADQELEACREWLCSNGVMYEYGDGSTEDLRAARRPKPLSLKEQSIALIDRIQSSKEAWDISELDTIRRALEQIDD